MNRIWFSGKLWGELVLLVDTARDFTDAAPLSVGACYSLSEVHA